MRPSLLLLPIALISTHVAPRPVVITGTIKSSTGIAIEGANAIVREYQVSAQTDRSGRYALTIKAEDGGNFERRPRGFESAPDSRAVSVQPGIDTIVADFVLQPDVNRLSEVVVTAGG